MIDERLEHPKVVQVLCLLASRPGGRPATQSEIERDGLLPALAICRGNPPLIVRREQVTVAGCPPRETEWKLTTEGHAAFQWWETFGQFQAKTGDKPKAEPEGVPGVENGEPPAKTKP